MNTLAFLFFLVAALPYVAYFLLKHLTLAYCEYLNLKRCRKLPPNVYGIVKLFLTAKQ